MTDQIKPPDKYPRYYQTEIMTYRSWIAMKTRCYNPRREDWKWYGAKGIKVCDRWLNSFENFLLDMGPRLIGLTLDRIDSNDNYCPENCRWATPKEQAMNTTKPKKIEFNGIIDSICGWAKRLGIRHSVIGRRLKRGWSIEDALTTALLPHNIKKKINSKTRLVTLDNQVVSVFKAAKLIGIPYSTVTERIGRGWSIKEALNDRIE